MVATRRRAETPKRRRKGEEERGSLVKTQARRICVSVAL
jgi:hypothetical protein